MGVSFTLRGLNTQLSLIRKAGYPIHVAQDICGSYYLNLDMSASLFDNIFWFKSTNPDLVDDVVIPSYSNYNFSVYWNNNLKSSIIPITTSLNSYSLNTNKFKHYKLIIKNLVNDGAQDSIMSSGIFRFYNDILATPDNNIFPEYAVSSHISSYLAENSFLAINTSGAVDSTSSDSLLGKYGLTYNPALSEGRGGVGPGDNEAFIYFSFSKPIEIKKMLFQPVVLNTHKYIIENMELYGTNDTLGDYSAFANDITTYVNHNGATSYMDVTSDFYTTKNTITWTLINNISNISSVFTKGSGWDQPVVPVYFEKLKDVAYYVDSNYWPDISYSHGLITNPDAGVPDAKADIDTYFVDRYLRFIGPAWLAKNITGGYNNSDLFENEDALQRQFVNFNGNFYRYIRFVVTSLVDASFGDPNASSYTTTVSVGSKRGFIGFEDFKFYENNTQIQVSDISDITYSSRYQDATYQEGSLADSSFSHLLDDSSGTFWISKELKVNGNDVLYEESDPSINDISHSNIGVYSRKYLGSAATSYTLQLKDNDNNPQTQTISGEWLQFEFKNNVSFNKIDFRPVGDHTPDIDIDGTSTSFLGTTPRSIAVLTSIDGTTWEVQNEYDNLDISAGVNEFTGNTNYRSLYHPNIKREITKVLDASGGSSSNPLTNADTGFSNISRDILKNMLDSDDPATVQRVHTMIQNKSGGNELDLLPVDDTGSAGSHTAEIYEIDINDNRIFHIVVNLNNSDNTNHTHGKLHLDGTKLTEEIATSDDLEDGEIITWWNYDNTHSIRYGTGGFSAFRTLDDPFWDTFTITLQIIENGTKYRISNSELNSAFNSGDPKEIDIPNLSNKVYLYLSTGLGNELGDATYEIIPGGIPSADAVKITSPAPGKPNISYFKSPLYINMVDPWIPIEFKDGDKMEFSLVYGTSNITDASNVALNSSGNRLGTNVVEDQDYYVRIHMK